MDFFCAENNLVIEADGISHQGREEHDVNRDAYLSSFGLVVIRIAVRDILQDMESLVGWSKKPYQISRIEQHIGGGEEIDQR